MTTLNFHHLRYFWAIAHDGSLTRAAERLHVSQSALSIQLKQLEERLGHPLFERKNRRLALTEAGRIALEYADAIFRGGEELLSTLRGRATRGRTVLRIGAVATLSRNFQLEWLRPLIVRPDVELVIRSGGLRELLGQLGAHAIDVVLSNLALTPDAPGQWYNHRVAEQPVSLVGRPARGRRRLRFPDDLSTVPVVLPSLQSSIRAGFDLAMDRAGIRPIVLAEVDDMAMLRLMAREAPGVTLVPPVVVQDELRQKVLVEYARIPAIRESFYAITASRRFPNPLLRALITGAKLPPAGAEARR